MAPLRDDADIVEGFLGDLLGVLREHYANYEVVLVDDGSRDSTVDRVDALLAKYENIRLIRLSRHFGTEVAITAGLESVIGDFIAVLLPESDPPDVIPEMVERARRSGGTVLAVRRGPRKEAWPTRLGSRLFHAYTRRFIDLTIPENSALFRVMSRQAVNALIQIKDRLRHIRSLASYVGYATEEFSYTPISRRGRPEQRGFFESINLGLSIIVAHSAQPLRFFSWLGLGVSALNALYVGYVMLVYLLSEDLVRGWSTQSVQTAVMFFFVFLILAVLCEYVGRILGEMSDRPLYYVREERNSRASMGEEAKRKNVVTRSLAN